MVGVAKRSGIHKKLSLCGLWDGLQRLYQMLDVEYCRYVEILVRFVRVIPAHPTTMKDGIRFLARPKILDSAITLFENRNMRCVNPSGRRVGFLSLS